MESGGQVGRVDIVEKLAERVDCVTLTGVCIPGLACLPDAEDTPHPATVNLAM